MHQDVFLKAGREDMRLDCEMSLECSLYRQNEPGNFKHTNLKGCDKKQISPPLQFLFFGINRAKTVSETAYRPQ